MFSGVLERDSEQQEKTVHRHDYLKIHSRFSLIQKNCLQMFFKISVLKNLCLLIKGDSNTSAFP